MIIEVAVLRANENGISIDAAKIAEVDILGGTKNIFFEGFDGYRDSSAPFKRAV